MNRPTLPKFVTRSPYTANLEKYCDYLEHEIERLKGNTVKDCNGCFGASMNDCEECPNNLARMESDE